MVLGLYFIAGVFLAALTMLVRKRSVAYISTDSFSYRSNPAHRVCLYTQRRKSADLFLF